ncbi:AIPR family protein [uncultured Alistipes sp.]|uniref:AIPR family protein n=1 Tax=uncultured Alistipes sp. TaxID=538949 RepID=UPI003209EB93
MKEIDKFYQSLMQDVVAMQSGDEDGNTQEQIFTRICLDMLSDAAETENVSVAYDERDLKKKGQHKINGYAISDNYETVDLFITLYANTTEIRTISKNEVDTASRMITNFFRRAVYNDYVNEIAESSEIFEFANTLANYAELRNNLIRVNAFILTNGTYKGELPASQTICGYNIYYKVIDIEYLYKISEQAGVPIELDFEDLNGLRYDIPCLAANLNNPEYEAYVAIIPGECLAQLYDCYGARLLEQNVRSFLQFTGKINKGIRETIKNEPHMFLAYNNGIAATADHVELDETGHFIRHISNLQIVNGGQTTASIFYTKKKDKADISSILVQVKLSVIKVKDQYADIVSRISRYANTQNKVNDADFSANNPALVEIERISRYVFAPATPTNNLQTAWFFERARGQYKTLRAKEGFTKSRQKAFDLKYPKKQVVTKVELAKYVNAWQVKYITKNNLQVLAIGPHIVVRGNEKNYAQFIKYNLPDIKHIDAAWFEDAIAKAILFKAADKRYGTKLSGDHIGELKQVVVPYTLSLLNIITNRKLDLYRIWKNQSISPALSDFIYDLMKQVNNFILRESPISHYIEWAKKAECWLAVQSNKWAYNLDEIRQDFIDEKNPPKRNHKNDVEDEESDKRHKEGIIRAIPFSLWKKIETWGRDTEMLQPTLTSLASDIAYKIKNNRKLNDSDISRGYLIYENVWQHNPELLEEADSLAEQDRAKAEEASGTSSQRTDGQDEITLELIQSMVEWDKRRRILEDWKWKAMKDVTDGTKPLTDRMKYAFYFNLQKLKKAGFPN